MTAILIGIVVLIILGSVATHTHNEGKPRMPITRIFKPCEGQYGECGREAEYRVEARSHPEVKHVCKTHVSWALSHTAYMFNDIAEVTNIRGVSQ